MNNQDSKSFCCSLEFLVVYKSGDSVRFNVISNSVIHTPVSTLRTDLQSLYFPQSVKVNWRGEKITVQVCRVSDGKFPADSDRSRQENLFTNKSGARVDRM